jgi:hypothetical protein
MIFVITHEDVVLPAELCATVYSRNALAKSGILALNAGHVDPGYEGPIIIRLINLRATPWILAMGEAVFTIVFEELNVEPGARLASHEPLPRDKALSGVREMAGTALSNALYDLYEVEVEKRLAEHTAVVEERLRSSLDERFLSRDEVPKVLLDAVLRGSAALVLLIAAFAGIAGAVAAFLALR